MSGDLCGALWNHEAKGSMTEGGHVAGHSHSYDYGGSSGSGCLVFLLAISAVLGYFIVSSDPTDGLDYASGDAPVEMKRALCYSDSGPCPPPGFKWTVPASGVIRTRFEREDIHDRTKLRGWFRLDARLFIEEQQEVRDCPAVVDWSLLVDGKAIAQGTVTAGSGDHEVTGTPPRDARFMRLTARRTDSLPCRGTFQWISAGLD
ncbi:hypothetical protein WBK31_34545 [Nonomuraea sp. N2-4H]|uniref:hypothetical protein n=1 Tax=Nonomuraea sp. N2-4H TaxID=3128898 RepID=UPI003247E97E